MTHQLMSPKTNMPVITSATKARSVAVSVRLEGALSLDADVISLLLAELCEAGTQGWQVERCHLFVKLLGQEINIVLVGLRLLPILEDVKLCQDLVREGAGHHKGGVASGATQVHQPARSKNYNSMSIREDEAVHLRLDVFHFDAREVLQVLHGNLVVEVADVAHDGVVLHLLHVFQRDDLEVTCGRGEDVDLAHNLLDGHHL